MAQINVTQLFYSKKMYIISKLKKKVCVCLCVYLLLVLWRTLEKKLAEMYFY